MRRSVLKLDIHFHGNSCTSSPVTSPRYPHFSPPNHQAFETATPLGERPYLPLSTWWYDKSRSTQKFSCTLSLTENWKILLIIKELSSNLTRLESKTERRALTYRDIGDRFLSRKKIIWRRRECSLAFHLRCGGDCYFGLSASCYPALSLNATGRKAPIIRQKKRREKRQRERERKRGRATIKEQIERIIFMIIAEENQIDPETMKMSLENAASRLKELVVHPASLPWLSSCCWRCPPLY